MSWDAFRVVFRAGCVRVRFSLACFGEVCWAGCRFACLLFRFGCRLCSFGLVKFVGLGVGLLVIVSLWVSVVLVWVLFGVGVAWFRVAWVSVSCCLGVGVACFGCCSLFHLVPFRVSYL